MSSWGQLFGIGCAHLELSGHASESCGYPEEETVVLGQGVSGGNGVVGFGLGVEALEDILRECLGDPEHRIFLSRYYLWEGVQVRTGKWLPFHPLPLFRP